MKIKALVCFSWQNLHLAVLILLRFAQWLVSSLRADAFPSVYADYV